jgi:P-type conjugative transfer protein TrbG
MDPRRFLILPAASLALGGCAILPRLGVSRDAKASAVTSAPAAARPKVVTAISGSPGPAPDAQAAATDGTPTPAPASAVAVAPEPRVVVAMAPIPNPGRSARSPRSPRSPPGGLAPAADDAARSGPAAIAAANASARETSRARGFLGGVQVFAYDPGRVYEVWTAPLRVTTLTLSPGETVVAKAAGDTVRWQIGETQSGEGANQRAHVMIKPLQRGLETNLVLATSRRVYLVQLRSGAPETFNAAVTWDLGSVLETPALAAGPAPSSGLVTPQGPLDAGFRIAAKGRRPPWTPTAVMTDGVRTFLTFPPGVAAGEAPALFALSPTGEAQLVNYRQQGGLWVVDRVLQAAELRVGGRKPQVVRIDRTGAAS